MWFLQTTCDNCFSLLDNVGRHNCYVMIRIKKQKIVPSDNRFSGYAPYQHEYPFPFASFNPQKPFGNVFMYAVEETDYDLKNRTWFCSNECAYNYAKENNLLMLYYDESLNSVRAITPHTVQINNELGGDKFRGLTFAWNQEWVVPKSSFKDLSGYNPDDFSEWDEKDYKIRKCQIDDAKAYLELLADDEFKIAFWGTKNKPNIKIQDIKDHINAMNIAYKRRMGAEWIIIKKKKLLPNETIGFIRIYCTNPSDLYNWYMEFGIKKSYRGQGIMSRMFMNMVVWTSCNGLDNIYAICEVSNTACLRLFKKFPDVKISRVQADDKYAGKREMYRFRLPVYVNWGNN